MARQATEQLLSQPMKKDEPRKSGEALFWAVWSEDEIRSVVGSRCDALHRFSAKGRGGGRNCPYVRSRFGTTLVWLTEAGRTMLRKSERVLSHELLGSGQLIAAVEALLDTEPKENKRVRRRKRSQRPLPGRD